jgi:hypothetical protein
MARGTRTIRTRALGPAPTGEGHLVEQWETDYDDPELPLVLTFRMGLVEGTPTCFAIIPTSRDQNIAGIQISELEALLHDENIAAAVFGTMPVRSAGVSPPLTPLDVQRELAQHRRGRITDAYLREVAQVYRDAFDRGDPPTVAVQAFFGLSRSTAGRHVGLAREHGFLNPTPRGVAGELDHEQEEEQP